MMENSETKHVCNLLVVYEIHLYSVLNHFTGVNNVGNYITGYGSVMQNWFVKFEKQIT